MSQGPAYAVIWYIFASFSVVTAAYVVLTRNIVRAAFALVFAFLGIAAQYVFLNADFLAASQMLIYAGGITVLMLFGVMLTHRVEGMELNLSAMKALPGVAIAVAFFGVLMSVIRRTNWNTVTPVESTGTTEAIGIHIMTDYLLPFEVVSVLLLVILVGAMYLARRDREQSPAPAEKPS